jgi:serine/threonine protein kinase
MPKLSNPYLFNNFYLPTQKEWDAAKKIRAEKSKNRPDLLSFKINRKESGLEHSFEFFRESEEDEGELLLLDRDDYLGYGATGKVKKALTEDGRGKVIRVSDADIEADKTQNACHREANIRIASAKLDRSFRSYIRVRESAEPKELFKHRKFAERKLEGKPVVYVTRQKVEAYDLLGDYDLFSFLDNERNQEISPKNLLIKLLIAIKLALATQRFFNIGLLHRDIKPENITLTVKGYLVNVDLVDLESCIELKGNEKKKIPTDQFMVTLGFDAPEVIDSSLVSRASDIFSVGKVFCIVEDDDASLALNAEDITEYTVELVTEMWHTEYEKRPELSTVMLQLWEEIITNPTLVKHNLLHDLNDKEKEDLLRTHAQIQRERLIRAIRKTIEDEKKEQFSAMVIFQWASELKPQSLDISALESFMEKFLQCKTSKEQQQKYPLTEIISFLRTIIDSKATDKVILKIAKNMQIKQGSYVSYNEAANDIKLLLDYCEETNVKEDTQKNAVLFEQLSQSESINRSGKRTAAKKSR